jgi:uncharacterized protein YpmB
MKSNLIIFLILFIAVITAIFMFFVLHKESYSSKEGFLSGFRQMYRPYIRKARLYTTNNYNALSGKTSVFLRRVGLW